MTNREEDSVATAWGLSDCARVSDLLVDYADGELLPEDAAAVVRHLEGCAACWQELAALEGSVRLALSVWRETPCANASLAPRRVRRTQQIVVAARALAAGLLIAAVGGAWWAMSPPERPMIVGQAGVPDRSEGQAASLPGDFTMPRKLAASPTADAAEELAALEAEINRESAAARLVASAEVLAGQPGAEESAERSLRFVVEIFPHTAAGADAARRLAAVLPKN